MNFSQPFMKQVLWACVVVSSQSNPWRKIYQSLDRNVEALFLCKNDSYECVVTNLPQDEFPLERMKELYGTSLEC